MAFFQLGNQGTGVQVIQTALIQKGYLQGTVDGNFGPQTTAAVKAFQQANGLSPDGIVGPATSAVLLGTAANTATTPGIDVSHFQGSVNWVNVFAAGTVFVFLKATEGMNFTDPTYQANLTDARNAGLLCGAYHFFDPTADPNDQADYFCSQASYKPGDLPPVLDIEATPPESWSNLSPAQSIILVQQWLNQVQDNLKAKPIIYAASSFMQEVLGGTTQFQGYPLWLARYAPVAGTLPQGWDDWSFWQYSQSGQIAGVTGAVDMDYFNGPPAELKAFTSSIAL